MPCPNASTTVTIPLSGSALVTIYDQFCNVLSGMNCSVLSINPNSGPVNSSTAPAVTMDAAGLHFSANGAVSGSVGTVRVTHIPSGQITNINYTVGASVTSISSGTATP